MKKKITALLLAAILSSQLIIANAATIISVSAEEAVLPISAQEQNTVPESSDETKTGDTPKETLPPNTDEPETGETPKENLPPDTDENEKTEVKQLIDILPKDGQKLEISKIYDSSQLMILHIDNSWLTADKNNSITDDVGLKLKIQLSSVHVLYDENGNVSPQSFKILINELFELEGKDSSKYELPKNNRFYQKIKDIVSAKIVPCELDVTLKTANKVHNAKNPVTYFYGQDKPVSFGYAIDLDNLTETLSTNENLDSETLIKRVNTIQSFIPSRLHFDFQNDKEVTGYVANGEKLNRDFRVKIAGKPKCVIDTTSYKAEGVVASASCSGTEIMLKAPEGYTIASEMDNFENFSDSITAQYDKNNPKIEYYLRNNMHGKYQNAVSMKTYTYEYYHDLPQIGEVQVELVQTEKHFSEYENKLLSNSRVNVMVPVKKYDNIIDDIHITLNIADAVSGQPISSNTVTLTPQDFAASSGEYVNAVFSADVDPDTQKEMEFTLNFENNAGSSSGGDSTVCFIKSDNTQNTYDILVMDKVKPHTKITAPSSDTNYTEFEVSVSDAYGIKSIKYNWDGLKNNQNDNEKWLSGENTPDYIDCSLNPENRYLFSLKSAKLDGKELYKADNINEGKHTLNLIITDNAGNERIESYTQATAPDITPPTITGMDITDNLSVVKDMDKTEFGTYYHNSVKIKVTATDNFSGKTISGINSVKLHYSDGQIKNMELAEGKNYYVCPLEIDKQNIYKDIHIVLTDNAGNEASYELKQYIASIQSNDLLLEDHIPDITLALADGEQQENIDISQFRFYSLDYQNGKIRFDFNDYFDGELCSGIHSIQIRDIAQNDQIISEQSFSDQRDRVSIDINISEISHGNHDFEITVKDRSGNKRTVNYKFRKDFDKPQNGWEVLSPEITYENWFDGQKELKIGVIANSNDNDIQKAEVIVKGLKEYKFELGKNDFADGKAEIALDKTIYPTDIEHQYIITGRVWDESGNISEYEPLVLHADIYNPEVKSVSVSKTQDALSQIINVLTFGVFSNQKLLLTADVSDDEYDSGIESVTIAYAKQTENMTQNENGQYVFELPPDTDVFSGEVIITATDKTGHQTICSHFSGTNDEEQASETLNNTFIMIEHNSPELTMISQEDHHNNWYNDRDKITLKISDNDSGIRKILFKDNEESFSTVFDSQQQTTFEIEKNIADLSEGKHRFYIDVFDNSGNRNSYEYYFNVDHTLPVIDSVRFFDGKNEDVTDKITKRTFGNYYNYGLKMVVNAHDPENEGISEGTSGIKNIVFGSGETLIPSDDNDGCFSYELPLYSNSSVYDIGSLVITDNAENTQVFYLKDLIDNMTSENITLENNAPLIRVFLTDGKSETKINTRNADYYGQDRKNASIKFSISDPDSNGQFSGISSIRITDTLSGNVVYSKTFGNQKMPEDTFIQKLSSLAEGKYCFKVTVTDNSQNKSSLSYEFCKDFISPHVKMDILSEATNIEGKKWFKGDEKITVRFTATDTNIQDAKIIVSGSNGNVEYSFSKKELETGYKTLILDQSVISTDKESKYTINGIVTDKAGNSSSYDETFLYRDFDVPVIESLHISKNTNAVDQVLNVLTFGVYSNNSILITAHVTDSQYDSGIKKVTINYAGLTKPAVMTKEANDRYTFPLNISSGMFRSNIEIIAEDNIGKTVQCYQFSDGKAFTDHTTIVLEKLTPQVSIEMPAPDYRKPSGEKWYNTSSDKKIKISAGDNESGLRKVNIFVNGNQLYNDSKGTAILTNALSENHDTFTYELSMRDMIQKFGIPDSKKFDISVSAADNSGNVKNVSESYYIDNIRPEVNEFTINLKNDSKSENIKDFIKEFEYGFYYLKDFTVTVSLSDTVPSSGLRRIEYRFAEYDPSYNSPNHLVYGETKTETVTNNQASFDVDANFKGQIYVKVIDNVGNVSDEVYPKAFVVDTKERHEAEEHFKTEFEAQSIYNHKVEFSINVIDKISGIESITTDISYLSKRTNNDTDNNKRDSKTDVVYIDNSGRADSNLWNIQNREVNLVTEISRKFVFDQDANDIQIDISMTDRAGNTSTYNTKNFTIDRTEPKINVSFTVNDKGVTVNDEDNYFNNDLKATINVTERNLDSLKVNGKKISPDSKDDSIDLQTYSYSFGEGDYPNLAITAEDIAGHKVPVTFESFYVDKTAPSFSYNLTNFPALFRLNKENKETERTLTVTVNDAHLAASYFIINNNPVNQDNASSSISYPFTDDGIYDVSVYARDISGNEKTTSLGKFEIDNTLPKLSVGDTSDNTVFSDTDAKIFSEVRKLKFTDKNISKMTAVVKEYSVEYDKNDNMSGKIKVSNEQTYDLSPVAGSDEIVFDLNEKMKIKDESCAYQVKVSASDQAGNNTEECVFTFYIIRNDKYMIYLPENDAQFNEDNIPTISDPYIFDNQAVSTEKIKDILICMLIRDTDAFQIHIKDTSIGEKTLNVPETLDINTNDEDIFKVIQKKDLANGMSLYFLDIKKEYFTTRFFKGDSTEIYVNADLVSEEGDILKSIKIGSISIDNEEPFGDYSAEFKKFANPQWYDGIFDKDTVTLVIDGLSKDVYYKNCVFKDNEQVIPRERINYYPEKNKIEITLGKGSHKIESVIYDESDNSITLDELNIYVGNRFEKPEIKMFTIITAIILSILVIGTIITIVVLRKKR